MTYYFHNKSSIIDISLVYIQDSENIEIFQSEAKVEQIIAIVSTDSVSCSKVCNRFLSILPANISKPVVF